jgi:hypothetical protein
MGKVSEMGSSTLIPKGQLSISRTNGSSGKYNGSQFLLKLFYIIVEGAGTY